MRKKEFYFYWLLPSFALGFGIGKVKPTDVWDVSVSLGICMFGFRIFPKMNFTEQLLEREGFDVQSFKDLEKKTQQP